MRVSLRTETPAGGKKARQIALLMPNTALRTARRLNIAPHALKQRGGMGQDAIFVGDEGGGMAKNPPLAGQFSGQRQRLLAGDQLLEQSPCRRIHHCRQRRGRVQDGNSLRLKLAGQLSDSMFVQLAELRARQGQQPGKRPQRLAGIDPGHGHLG